MENWKFLSQAIVFSAFEEAKKTYWSPASIGISRRPPSVTRNNDSAFLPPTAHGFVPRSPNKDPSDRTRPHPAAPPHPPPPTRLPPAPVSRNGRKPRCGSIGPRAQSSSAQALPHRKAQKVQKPQKWNSYFKVPLWDAPVSSNTPTYPNAISVASET